MWYRDFDIRWYTARREPPRPEFKSLGPTTVAGRVDASEAPRTRFRGLAHKARTFGRVMSKAHMMAIRLPLAHTT